MKECCRCMGCQVGKFNLIHSILNGRGYRAHVAFIQKPNEIYDDYLKMPFEIIEFHCIEQFACVPDDFMLVNRMDVEYSMVVYQYEYDLSYDEFIDKREEVADKLLSWIQTFPKKDGVRRCHG